MQIRPRSVKLIMINNQKQKAGDNANQTQIENQVVYNNFGLSVSEVVSIIDKRLETALSSFSADAVSIAKERNDKFAYALIKIMSERGSLEAFRDPAFQILLAEAQKSAAASEREEDYQTLAELMHHRFEKKDNRKTRVGISRAIKVVSEIDSKSLLALTVCHCAYSFSPSSSHIEQGLKLLDELFGKVIYDTLPDGTSWLDHLDILDAVRVTPQGMVRLKKIEDIWYQDFDGYIKNGIKKDSENYNKAQKILSDARLPKAILSQSGNKGDYVKIAVVNKKNISSSLKAVRADGKIVDFSQAQQKALEDVYDLYDGTKMRKPEFINAIDKYANLKALRLWWNGLSNRAFTITEVGAVLAHSNAQRIDPSLPDLN